MKQLVTQRMLCVCAAMMTLYVGAADFDAFFDMEASIARHAMVYPALFRLLPSKAHPTIAKEINRFRPAPIAQMNVGGVNVAANVTPELEGREKIKRLVGKNLAELNNMLEDLDDFPPTEEELNALMQVYNQLRSAKREPTLTAEVPKRAPMLIAEIVNMLAAIQTRPAIPMDKKAYKEIKDELLQAMRPYRIDDSRIVIEFAAQTKANQADILALVSAWRDAKAENAGLNAIKDIVDSKSMLMNRVPGLQRYLLQGL
jgi:hypothetical protein